MITIRTQAWDNESTGKVHILTNYQVCLTEDFTIESNIVDDVNGVVENGMLNIGKINLIVPENEVWYTRFRRSFADGTTEDNYSTPKPAYGAGLNNNKFIKSTSTIDKPSIKVTGFDTHLEIKTSEAKIDGNDGHLYTTTLIYSGDKLVYKNMKDEENLTSLFVTKEELDYTLLGKLTICVIYGTNNNAESPIGKFIFNSSKLDFNLDGVFNNIPFNKNQVYKLTSTNNDVIISNVFLYGGVGEDLGESHSIPFLNKQSGLTRYSEVYINTEHLKADTTYTLRLSLSTNTLNPDVDTKNFIITTESMDIPFVVDDKYVYSKIDYKLYDGGSNGYLQLTNKLDNFNIAYGTNYKDIFLSSLANPYSLSKFKFYPNNIELSVAKEMELVISDIVNYKISFVTPDKKLIVVLADTNTELKVIEFDYNPFDKVVLTKRATTVYTMAKTKDIIKNNSIALSDDGTELYYLTMNGTNPEFGKINIANKSLTILPSRPNYSTNTTLVNLGGDKFLSAKGGTNPNTFYIYDVQSNSWTPYAATYPDNINFANSNLAFLRKDGNILLVPSKGNSAKYLVVLKVKEKTYSTETIDIPANMVVADIIRDSSGAFIIVAEDRLNTSIKGMIYYS